MFITTLSSRAFHQDASKPKNAANDGPVMITDRGRPTRVLLRFDDYGRTHEHCRFAVHARRGWCS